MAEKIIYIKLDATEYKKLVDGVVGTKQAINDLRAQNKELNKDYKANSAVIEENNAKIKNLTQSYNQQTKAIQLDNKEVKGSEGAYRRLELQFAVASQKAKDLAASENASTEEVKKAAIEANKLNEKLKAIDATTGIYNRTVGDYKNQIIAAVRELTTLKNETSKMEKEQKQLAASNQITTTRYKDLTISIDNNKKKIVESTKAIEIQKKEMKALGMGAGEVTGQMSMMPGAMGMAASSASRLGSAFQLLLNNPIVRLIALIGGFIAGIGYAIKSSMEFSAQMSKVKAVTGATNEELQLLKQNAKDVGAVTTKTATEVGAMQFEFAKLGFTVSEILNATKASVDLSTASGATLARTAEVMGTTLRGFGLDASNATMVADTMAKSFSTSALDMEKFAESMKYISPIAKQTGVSLAEATTMLALLADRGISGSMAGTSLRMIMLRLGEESGSLTEKITKLSEKGLGLAAANEEVGQRAMTALLVLSDQSKMIPELTKRYTDVAGAVDEMARIMRDNLTGDITIAKSAWEGFMLSIEDGEGVLTNVSRFFVQAWTGFLSDVTLLSKDLKKIFTSIGDEMDYFDLRIQAIFDSIGMSFGLFGDAVSAAVTGDFSKFKTLFSDIDKGMDAFSKDKVDQVFLAGKAVKNLENEIRKANKQLTPEQQREQQEALNVRKNFREKFKIDEITDSKILYQNKLAELKKGLDDELITIEEYNKAKKAIDAEYYKKLKEQADKQKEEFEKARAEREKQLEKDRKETYMFEDLFAKIQANKLKTAKDYRKIQEDVLKLSKESLQNSIDADIEDGEIALQKQLDKQAILKENQANFLADSLEIAKGDLDAEAEIKKQMLAKQMQDELSAKYLTEEQKVAITQKFAEAEKEIEKNKFMAKLDMAAQVAGGLADLLGRETKAGKFAAAAQVAITGGQDAFTTGSTAAKYFAAGNIPMGILAGVQTGIIVSKTAKAISDIYAVDTDKVAGSGETTKTTVTEKFHTGTYQPASKSQEQEITRTLLTTERILSPQQTGLFDSIVNNVQSLGGADNVVGGVGMNGINQFDTMAAAFSTALNAQKAPVVIWKDYDDAMSKKAQFEQNRTL